MNKDTIFIHGLEIKTVIGVYEHERHIRQTVLLDLDMTLSTRAAANSEDLRYTVDYASVSSRLTAYVESTDYQLIESLAEQVTGLVLREFAVEEVRLKLSKPGAVKNAANVGIVLTRSRQ